MMKKVSLRNIIFLIITVIFLGSLIYILWNKNKNTSSNTMKSVNDTREYRIINLHNGLKAVLVSDPQTEKSAVALSISMGSLNEPKDAQGIAHFLEHMLFLGTKKFPGIGEYQNFIESHGGRANAYTSFENTVYYFDIFNKYLSPALDIFSQFFISPLFQEEMVDKEKNAVDAEYKLHNKDDNWRLYHVIKNTSNPNHPFYRFSIGNLNTLSSTDNHNLRDKVLKFYNNSYSSDNMILSVYGSESLDTLEKWVNQYFGEVKRKQIIHAEDFSKIPIFTQNELKKIIYVQSVGEKIQLLLTFPIPDQTSHFRTKPAGYISKLLSQQGENSIYAYLLNNNWINDMDADTGRLSNQQSQFEIVFDLTQEGLKHVLDIVTSTFQYIKKIEATGVEEWRYNEMKEISELQFKFQEKKQPTNEVLELVESAQYYPEKDLLRAKKIFFEYSQQEILNFLSYLNPNNLRILVLAPNVSTDKIEPYFQVPYKIEDIDNNLIKNWENDSVVENLQLPPKNKFIANTVTPITHKESNKTYPTRLDGAYAFNGWCLEDLKFKNPLTDIYYLIRSSIFNSSSTNSVLTDIYINMLVESLNQKLFPALEAGNQFQLKQNVNGIQVSTSGYTAEILKMMIQTINDEILQGKINAQRFESNKEYIYRHYKEDLVEAPAFKQFHELPATLLSSQWTTEQKLESLKNINLDNLYEFVKTAFKNIQLEYFAYGNLYCDKVSPVLNELSKPFALNHSFKFNGSKVIKIPDSKLLKMVTQTEHPDASVLVYYQPSDKSYLTFAKLYLLQQILSEPFYTDLRTKRQMGYVVAVTAPRLLDTLGIGYVAQSPNFKSNDLFNAVSAFLKESGLKSLTSLSEKDFEQNKTSIINQLLKQPVNRREHISRFLDEIFNQTYAFNRNELIADAVSKVSLQELISFYNEIHLDVYKRSALLLQTPDKPIQFWENVVDIQSIDHFKKEASYF